MRRGALLLLLVQLVVGDNICISLDAIAEGKVDRNDSKVTLLHVNQSSLLQEFTVHSPDFALVFLEKAPGSKQVKLHFNGYNERIEVLNATATNDRTYFYFQTTAKHSFLVRVEEVHFHLVPHSCVPFFVFLFLVVVGGLVVGRRKFCTLYSFNKVHSH